MKIQSVYVLVLISMVTTVLGESFVLPQKKRRSGVSLHTLREQAGTAQARFLHVVPHVLNSVADVQARAVSVVSDNGKQLSNNAIHAYKQCNQVTQEFVQQLKKTTSSIEKMMSAYAVSEDSACREALKQSSKKSVGKVSTTSEVVERAQFLAMVPDVLHEIARLHMITIDCVEQCMCGDRKGLLARIQAHDLMILKQLYEECVAAAQTLHEQCARVMHHLT